MHRRIILLTKHSLSKSESRLTLRSFFFGNSFVMPDHFSNDERQELLRKLWVELSIGSKCS